MKEREKHIQHLKTFVILIVKGLRQAMTVFLTCVTTQLYSGKVVK